MTVAVLLAPGFEEIEALTPVDVLRRAEITVEILGFSAEVTGSHGITVKADKVFDGDLSAYDMIVLPGGLPGSNHLRDNDELIQALQDAAQSEKWLAAICAAPKVLGRAGLLDNKRYTCYPGVEEEIGVGNHSTELLVQDARMITAQGAGVSLAFAYRLVEVLGGDAKKLSNGMIYDQLFEEN
ncbi:DJ-1 family glyoxalase III [Streptococcus merionis]|uniref:4-methyl-5(B-hydroxyethyl)-thiazole monophosphate biosynthesis protein n=1 Tax=Streptococcus merionis TaxID=400065 RepID=A0A239SNK6_9STRE|nr:DJ-1 family glyoxalase III [Streptococcus merionis]SNU86243.1 4-methyl-5(b-hydroxyethyl)-thiazole monophosphate biosynthesis protein [Streptococcus merionis]